jgi:hypothetical protein
MDIDTADRRRAKIHDSLLRPLRGADSHPLHEHFESYCTPPILPDHNASTPTGCCSKDPQPSKKSLDVLATKGR